MKSKKERELLKKIISEVIDQKLINEEMSDYGGITPWISPYGYGGGGAVKGSKSSMGAGVYGNSLYSIFIDPFVNAAKVVGSELGQVGVRLVSLIRVLIESVLSALVPKFQADYDKIFKTQQKQIDKIKEKYRSAYEAVDDAWEHEDIQFFSFMHDPTTWLSYKMITAKPQAILSVMDTIAEGNNSLVLYLRDIRNRLYGAQMPGSHIPARIPANESYVLEGDSVDDPDVIEVQGLKIHIDRPKGFVQTGKNSDGESWEREYKCDYGYIDNTQGGDGEDLDVYVGSDLESPTVFIVTQVHKDGEFDEYKAFVGFNTKAEVLNMYKEHTPIEHLSDIDEVPLGVFKGMYNIDPLTEAVPAVKKKQKTKEELLADALTSPEFKKLVMQSPKVQEMRKDAKAIEQSTANNMNQAVQKVMSANSVEDLARLSGGAWQPDAEYGKLKPEEKAEVDQQIIGSVHSSMKKFYITRTEELINYLLETGINENSDYIRSLRSTLSKLQGN